MKNISENEVAVYLKLVFIIRQINKEMKKNNINYGRVEFLNRKKNEIENKIFDNI